MSNDVLALMCKEMIEDLQGCMEILKEGSGELRKEWVDKIASAYAIIYD